MRRRSRAGGVHEDPSPSPSSQRARSGLICGVSTFCGAKRRPIECCVLETARSAKLQGTRVEGGYDHGDTYGHTNLHHVTRGYDVYTHGGGRQGYGSLFWSVPERSLAIVVRTKEGQTLSAAFPWQAVDCWLDGECS